MTMKKKQPKRARYGSGSLWLRGTIWWVKWREVRHPPGGVAEYIQNAESTGSEDREFAEGVLKNKILDTGGRRPTVVPSGKITYDDLRKNLLAYYVAKKLRSLKKDKAGVITLATLPRLDKAFKGWLAKDISAAHVRRFRQEGNKDGLSDARMNRYVSTLRKMFRQGARDELITAKEMPAYFEMVNEPNEARGAIFITPKWYGPLRKALPEPLRSAFTVAYHNAIRVNELMRIRWRDIDVKKRRIQLPGEATKTGRPRLVPLPRDFDRKPGAPDALVFPLGNYRKRWIKTCVAAGAGAWVTDDEGNKHYEGLLLRHTRHTAIRNMADAGLHEARIMAVSGHMSRSMFDRYNIGREEDIAAAGKAIEQFHRRAQKRKPRK
jgi:integrase